jgi:hypothetical protein
MTIDLATAPHARIYTSWGTVLYVDPASGELRHGAIETSPENAVIAAAPEAMRAGRRGRIMHTANGVCEAIICRAARSLSASRTDGIDGEVGGTLFELVHLERGLIALREGGQFLCAEPTGSVTLSRSLCSVWECFLASEDWCTDREAAGEALTRDLGGAIFDRKLISHHIIDPLLRTEVDSARRAMRLLFFGYRARSHGRIYYDLCKRLYDRGYIADVMDWQADHTDHIAKLSSYYDLFVTSLDGVSALVDRYKIPYEKIIALSHGDYDIPMLIDEKGLEPFTRFAAYGVVSPSLLCSSLNLGVTRIPAVVSIGIDFAEFQAEVPERLTTVGYASTISVISKYGVELKREHLARECAEEAGLQYRRSASSESYLWFVYMPEFYKSVDAIVIPSLQEGAGLPAMEAAAAGRLVISTSTGHFPLNAARGGGIIAPMDAGKFKAFAVNTLRHYRDNPVAYVDKCRKIQEAARQFDWQYAIDDWIELIESARHREGQNQAAYETGA